MVVSARKSSVPEMESLLAADWFETTLPPIYSYFFVRTGHDRAIAEDLTQETFLVLTHELNRGWAPANLIEWLFGVARHKLVDHYRRQERHDHLIIPWNETPIDRPDVTSWTEYIGQQDVIATALGQMVFSQRLALILHYMDGLSIVEIAQELGKSEHAVESLLARGRSNLRKHLMEEDAS